MIDPLLNRMPPSNIDAEEAVLSALFINNSGFEYTEDLTPSDFYKGAHNKIYAAMLTLREEKNPVDLVTVMEELKKRDELESVGGVAYLASISDAAPVAVNVGQYAQIIKNLASAREVISIALEIAETGFLVQNVEEYINQAQSKILQVQTTSSRDRFYQMEELMIDAVNRIEDAQTRDIELGYKLGMPKLDNFIQVYGSKLILIAARPKMGKTALALSISKYLAERGVRVGFLSIEMDKEALSDRLLSIDANVNSLLFYAKNSLSKESIRDIKNSAEFLSTLPITIDDSDCQIEDVKRKCRKLSKTCDVIFIDQLSKIRGRAGASKFETYTDNCSEIALLKKELRKPIFLLCQLNRNVDQRDDKKPIPSDLKQTGMLEEDADMVFLLYRPGYYDENTDPSRTEIILSLNRNGGTGTEQQVLFKQKRGMFELI